MKNLKNVLLAMTMLICIMSLTSCGSWFYCNASSYGATPIQKSYYVVPNDSSLIDDFAFIEYAEVLKKRLNEVGYNETSPEIADLCIVLDYFMGEERYVGSTTSTYTSSYIVQNGALNTKTSANANAKVYGNTAIASGSSTTNANAKTTTQTFAGSSTSQSAQYSTPVGVDILAINTSTEKPTWKVEIRDQLSSWAPSTFRAIMPWLISSAQPYFGTSYEGQPKITKGNGEKMGLKWPY